MKYLFCNAQWFQEEAAEEQRLEARLSFAFCLFLDEHYQATICLSRCHDIMLQGMVCCLCLLYAIPLEPNGHAGHLSINSTTHFLDLHIQLWSNQGNLGEWALKPSTWQLPISKLVEATPCPLCFSPCRSSWSRTCTNPQSAGYHRNAADPACLCTSLLIFKGMLVLDLIHDSPPDAGHAGNALYADCHVDAHILNASSFQAHCHFLWDQWHSLQYIYGQA